MKMVVTLSSPDLNQLVMKPLLLLLLFVQAAKGQTLQYGVSADFKWDICVLSGYQSSFRLAIGGGVGVMLNNNLMPHAQLALVAFQGGLGSSLSMAERNKLVLETNLTVGFTGGGKRAVDGFRRPLYTFGKFVPTPLYNPFNGYGTLATTQVFRLSKFGTPNALGKYRYSQKIGSVTVGGAGFDINYYNDGTPFHWMGLGDGKDRYWTGGGFVSFHLPNYHDNAVGNPVRNVIIGFDRFTGFTPDAFEVADQLGLGFVPYKDVRQAFFNKGRLFAGIELAHHPGAAVYAQFLDNDKLDVQNVIHALIKAPRHLTTHQAHFAIGLYYNKKYWDL